MRSLLVEAPFDRHLAWRRDSSWRESHPQFALPGASAIEFVG